MATYYIDHVAGSDAAAGTSWGAAWKTITLGATAARIAPGDIIRIAKSPAPTSLGINGTWTYNSATVTLASAVTSNIYDCSGAWTASANVTCTTSSTRQEGTLSSSAAIASGFTTGKIAYKALGSAIDFSGYRQVSFWIRSNAAVSASVLTLTLCSDTAGATPVNTIAIPAIPATNVWQMVTVDTAATLGASIQSIALNALSDPGTVTILIDNILACKDSSSADSLTLSSLISKSSTDQEGSEGWFPIKSINGTTVILNGAFAKYGGTTATVTTYKRETIKLTPAASLGANVQEVMDSGTAGNNIQFQGGYNTSSSVQDGESYFSGVNGYGYGLMLNAKSYITINRLNFSNYYHGVYLFGASSINTIDNIASSCNTGDGIGISTVASFNTINTISNINCNSNGISVGAYNTIGTITNANGNNSGINLSGSVFSTINIITNLNCNSSGINTLSTKFNTINTITNIKNNSNGIYYDYASFNTINAITNMSDSGSYGFFITDTDGASTNNTFKNVTSASSGIADIINEGGTTYFVNSTLSSGTPMEAFVNYSGGSIFSSDEGGVADKISIYSDNGYATTLSATDGTSWNIYPTSNLRASYYPFSVLLTTIYCSANIPVFVSAIVQKSHATDIAAQIICKGGQISGVASDVYDTKANDTSEETLSITFTPTADGFVAIKFLGWWVANAATQHVTLRTLKTNARKYGKVFYSNTQSTQTLNYLLKYDTETTNPYITQTTQATVHAYTGISYDGTLHVTSAHTLNEIYDWTQDYLQINPSVDSFFTTTDGINYTSTVPVENTSAITGGGTINVGANAYTGGGTYNGIIITSTNRIVHLKLTGVISGSTYYIEKTSDHTEYANGTASGDTDNTFTYTVDVGVTVRVRKSGYEEWTTTATITNTGLTLAVGQKADATF